MNVYPDTVTVKRATGSRVRGQPTYSSATRQRARVDQSTTFLPSVDGERVTSRYTVFLEASVAIGDLIGVEGTDYPALTVDAQKDIAGKVHGYRVRL